MDQIVEVLRSGISPYQGVAGLKRKEASIVHLLVEAGRVSHAALQDSLFPAAERDRALVTMRVHMTNVRRKLREHGVEITTLYGGGYEMPQESRDRMKGLAR